MRIRTALLIPLALAVSSLPTGQSRSTWNEPNSLARGTHRSNDADAIDTTTEKSDVSPALAQQIRGGQNAVLAEVARRLKIGSYFALWYALNIVYNIVNKQVLNVLPAPLTVGSIQFGVGALYASLLWTFRLRKTPKLSRDGKGSVRKIGFYHCFGQLMTIVSLGSGPVSFTHIVKALEPFFSALVSAFMFGIWMKPQVYLSLIPVVAGVGYACLKEKYFSWLAFCTAMGSNLAFALRAVTSKSAMTSPVGEHVTSANLFGLVTWAAFVVSVPVALLMEGSTFVELWEKATETMDPMKLGRSVVVSGLFHYLNNEVMYLALSNVHPVTLAVGNTMKRVFIMVASVMVFQNPVSLKAGVGSAIGIFGVLLYSLTKNYYELQERRTSEGVKLRRFRSSDLPKQTRAETTAKAKQVRRRKKKSGTNG